MCFAFSECLHSSSAQDAGDTAVVATESGVHAEQGVHAEERSTWNTEEQKAWQSTLNVLQSLDE